MLQPQYWQEATARSDSRSESLGCRIPQRTLLYHWLHVREQHSALRAPTDVRSTSTAFTGPPRVRGWCVAPNSPEVDGTLELRRHDLCACTYSNVLRLRRDFSPHFSAPFGVERVGGPNPEPEGVWEPSANRLGSGLKSLDQAVNKDAQTDTHAL